MWSWEAQWEDIMNHCVNQLGVIFYFSFTSNSSNTIHFTSSKFLKWKSKMIIWPSSKLYFSNIYSRNPKWLKLKKKKKILQCSLLLQAVWWFCSCCFSFLAGKFHRPTCHYEGLVDQASIHILLWLSYPLILKAWSPLIFS